jgi:hypothetical protein
MKFYRLHLLHNYGESAGYQWFTVHTDAEKAKASWCDTEDKDTGEIEPIAITPTKAGLLAALNHYASHCDNG